MKDRLKQKLLRALCVALSHKLTRATYKLLYVPGGVRVGALRQCRCLRFWSHDSVATFYTSKGTPLTLKDVDVLLASDDPSEVIVPHPSVTGDSAELVSEAHRIVDAQRGGVVRFMATTYRLSSVPHCDAE